MRQSLTIILIVLLSAFNAISYAGNNFLEDEIPHNLFMDSIIECEDCITYTIIVSDVNVNKDISSVFKSIAESFGKKHAGAIIKWGEALKKFRFFKNHKCSSFTDMASKVVIYIDKDNDYCKIFPYNNHTQLIAMISIISSNIGEIDNIESGNWRLMKKQAIDIYANENKIVHSFKQIIYEFIDYIDDLQLGYKKNK